MTICSHYNIPQYGSTYGWKDVPITSHHIMMATWPQGITSWWTQVPITSHHDDNTSQWQDILMNICPNDITSWWHHLHMITNPYDNMSLWLHVPVTHSTVSPGKVVGSKGKQHFKCTASETQSRKLWSHLLSRNIMKCLPSSQTKPCISAG